jgi:hypothetical protein
VSRITPSAAYCFGGAAGASAGAGGAASAGAAGAAASAGAAGAASAGAGGVALSVAAGGGGVAAGSVLAASCFAQAVSISAATSALRASLVFIRSVPRREARVVRKPDERVFFVPRILVMGRAGKFYRVPVRFETGQRHLVWWLRQRAPAVCLTGAQKRAREQRRRVAIWQGSRLATDVYAAQIVPSACRR